MFGGYWFLYATLPFGWKISSFIYHSIGLASSGYLRAPGTLCSLYINDRLNGEILTSSGPWSVLHASVKWCSRLVNEKNFPIGGSWTHGRVQFPGEMTGMLVCPCPRMLLAMGGVVFSICPLASRNLETIGFNNKNSSIYQLQRC